jgi:hypothetical protein
MQCSAKSPDFATHAEQTIQVHNQSLCEARSNHTNISAPNKSSERIHQMRMLRASQGLSTPNKSLERIH